MTRAPWHEYFMLLAKIVALRSGCNSRPAGAVIVKDKRILATGYNGPMPGAWHCTDRGPGYCFRREKGIPDIDKYNYCRATHAEANAIAQAARFGISVQGADLYCTLAPCYVCLKLIASAGIKAVYYEYDYGTRNFERDAFWKKAIQEAGLEEFRQIKVSEEVLAQLEELLPYPTSKRRLAPTDFLEHFESRKSYVLPSVEVFLNKLKYQTAPKLKEISFVIEHPSTPHSPFKGSFLFEGEKRDEKFLPELERHLRKERPLSVGLLWGEASFKLTFIHEAEIFRLRAEGGRVPLDTFREVVLFIDSLAYYLASRLALPFKLECYVDELLLSEDA